MSKWVTKYDGPDGWQRLKSCICPYCGESALLYRNYTMDGVSCDLCPSDYCPHCGMYMVELGDNNE